MKVAAILRATVLSTALGSTVFANTYGSVEPIANTAVVDTDPLGDLSLDVREAFAARLLQCGIVDDVIAVLTATKSVTTINGLNTHVEVGAGGFAGTTNPSFVYTVIDSGPNAASAADIARMTDGLGYVLSQGSAFLLDADNPDSFDFPANYVVLNFASRRRCAAPRRSSRPWARSTTSCSITDSSGYTQFGRAYLSLQSFVPDDRFIAGYVKAASGVRRRIHAGRRWSARRSFRAARRFRATTGSPVRAAKSTCPGSRPPAITRCGFAASATFASRATRCG